MGTTARAAGDEISRSKQRILALCAEVSSCCDQLLKAAAKTITKGSIYTQKKKCGNPHCRCARGQLHTARILSFSHEGKTRLIPLTKYFLIEVMEIEKQVKSYQRFRHNRAEIVHCFKELIGEINKLENALRIEVPGAKKGAGDGKKKKEDRAGSKKGRR